VPIWGRGLSRIAHQASFIRTEIATAVPALFFNLTEQDIPEASMDGPLLDLANPAVWRMIKLAKKRGYVTRDELDHFLPSDVFSPEQIKDVFEQLSEMGIRVVEAAADVRKRYQHLARELRSFASGQRGQGRELLESAAALLESEAEGFWSQYRPGSWVQGEGRWFLVFDQQQGIQIAEHDPSGDWVGQGGQRLTQVTHWRSLPLPHSGELDALV
jgi:Sigma-70 factor, region 1.1